MSTPELFHTWNNFVANITLGMLWADRMCALATIFTLGESVKFIRFGLGPTVFFFFLNCRCCNRNLTWHSILIQWWEIADSTGVLPFPDTADPMAGGDLPDIPPIPPALGVSRAGKRQRIFNPLVPTYIDYPASHREKAGHSRFNDFFEGSGIAPKKVW